MQLANLYANIFWLISVFFAAVSWIVELAGLIASQSTLNSILSRTVNGGLEEYVRLSTGWWSWVLQAFVIMLIVVC